MKIGLFTDTYSPDINGVVTSILALKKILEANNHQVYVVTNHDDVLKSEYKDQILKLPGLKLDFLYGYKLTNPIQIKAAKKIKDWNLDIIHVHQEFGVGIFGRIVANAYDIPLVSTYHTKYEDYTHYINYFKFKSVDNIGKKTVAKISKNINKKSNIVIAPSLKTKEMLIKYGLNNRIEIIPTGIDLDKFKYENIDLNELSKVRSEVNIKDDESVFIYLGRIAKEKSIDVIIQAFKHLKNKNIKAKLIIVGGGPELESLKNLTKDLDLNDKVYFTGVKQRDQVMSYYHVAEAFISASTTETQGLTYIEALACGLPVFARFDTVIKDIVIENKTGFYFDDHEDLALKIESFINNPDFKVTLKANALKMSENYSLDTFYKNIIQCYETAIEMEKNA